MKISTVDLRPGMRLQDDCLAITGRRLFPRGSVLTEKMIRTLRAWGVVEVDVEEQGERSEALKQELELFWARLKPFYIRNDLSSAPLKELIKVAIKRCVLEKGRFLDELSKRAELHIGGQGEKEKTFERLGKQWIIKLLEREIGLFSLPDIYQRVMGVINDPRASATHVAEVVGQDTSLSARLLKLVNSPFYGFTQKVDTISRAIALLGTDKLTILAQGVLIVRTFAGIPLSFLNMEEFWAHSVACGIIARLLASQKVGLDDERFFLLGLIHNLGRLIVIKELPEVMLAAMSYAALKKIPLYQAENRIMGVDHALVGGLLGSRWHFPQHVADSIHFHHRPRLARDKLGTSILHVADILTSGLFLGHSGNL